MSALDRILTGNRPPCGEGANRANSFRFNRVVKGSVLVWYTLRPSAGEKNASLILSGSVHNWRVQNRIVSGFDRSPYPARKNRHPISGIEPNIT